jgi:GNAT superfamily N-acetyltransferase
MDVSFIIIAISLIMLPRIAAQRNVGLPTYNPTMITISNEAADGTDGLALMAELGIVLQAITGSNGSANFDVNDLLVDGARFAVARDADGMAVGCGAFRPFADGVAEIKRMYARPGHRGVGSAILAHLEQEAAALGYAALCLETRLVNQRAVAFYEARQYRRIPNYGKYAGNPLAACFEKQLG